MHFVIFLGANPAFRCNLFIALLSVIPKDGIDAIKRIFTLIRARAFEL